MKIKFTIATALFVGFLGFASAQTNKVDSQIDGFKGNVSNVDQKLYEAHVNNDKMERGELMEHLQTVYTSRGLRKSMTYLSVGENDIIFRTRYKHDGFGLITLEHIVDPKENVIGRTYYLYNKQNVLRETYVEDAERQIENRVLMSYDAQGRLSERSFNDPANNVYKREVYTYGADGNIKTTVVYDRSKKKIQEWRYEYDDHNQPISQTLYDYTEAEPEIFITLFRYQYDDHNNWIQKVEYTLENDHTTPVYITERKLQYF